MDELGSRSKYLQANPGKRTLGEDKEKADLIASVMPPGAGLRR
jgi:hypothetical protein